MSCHSGPGLTTLVLMLSQDQHGNAIVVLKPSWSSHTGIDLVSAASFAFVAFFADTYWSLMGFAVWFGLFFGKITQ